MLAFRWKGSVVAAGVVAGITMVAHAQLNLGGETKVIAHFDLSVPVTETPQNIPPFFGGVQPTSMKALLRRFQEAREDANVRAVLLEVEDASLGLGQIQEIRAALKQFSAVNKPIYVHADTLTTGTYALATAASHIAVTPTGDVWLTGLYGEAPYLKDMLDKMGILADVMTCGDYKTAAEPLTRSQPSPASDEMTQWLLDGLYESLVAMIAEGRSMPVEKVKELIDNGPYFAEDALKAGLIDAVQHRQDFVANLKERYGSSAQITMNYGEEDELDLPQDPFRLFAMIMDMINPSKKASDKPTVGIVYVEGAIMPGEAEPSPFGGTSGAYSSTIRKALDDAAKDDAVKAVVLRVDSPGGSALASEIILEGTRRVAAKKPLVVSMGNVAGSGGYYVTCGAETVFADETTITGSIGVVMGKLVTTDGWKKLGINWSAHQRGKNAMVLSSAAPFSPDERKKMESYMVAIYDVFKNHVTAARGKKLAKPIDDMAGGRVYTGRQALDLGLVDKMGGLDDAIKFAASKAGLGDYETRVIPEPPNIFQLMMGGVDDEYIGTGGAPHAAAAAGIAELLRPGVQPWEGLLPLVRSLDPARAEAMMRTLQRVALLHTEHVLMMTPADWVIR